jgi:hypothetical protein
MATRTINHSINRATNQSINQPTKQSINGTAVMKWAVKSTAESLVFVGTEQVHHSDDV